MLIDLSFMNDIDIHIDDGEEDIDDAEILAQQDSIVCNTIAALVECTEVYGNYFKIKNHIKKFGVTKETLDIINKGGRFYTALGLTIPYTESDDVTEITVPDEAEIEMILESISSRLGSIKENVIATLSSLKTKMINFFKAYFTTLGRWHRKLDAMKAKKFGHDVDIDDFGNRMIRAYSYEDMTKLMSIITNDIKSPLPAIVGKEYTWKHFSNCLPLIGYEVEVFTKEVNYLGEKLPGIEKINISFKRNASKQLKREKASLNTLGWQWGKTTNLFQQIKSFLDIIRTIESQCTRVGNDVDRFIRSIEYDYMNRTSMESVDTKKAEILYWNAIHYSSAFFESRIRVVHACLEIVSIYHSILSKAKVVNA